MFTLRLQYRITAEGLHSRDDDYLFSLRDENGKCNSISVDTASAALVMDRLIKHFASANIELKIECVDQDGKIIAAPSREQYFVDHLVAPFQDQLRT